MGGLFVDQTPLAWSDVVTTWPDDADLDADRPVSPPGVGGFAGSGGGGGLGGPDGGGGLAGSGGGGVVGMDAGVGESGAALAGASADRFDRPIDPSAWAARREPWAPASGSGSGSTLLVTTEPPTDAAWPADPLHAGVTSAGAFGSGSSRLRLFDPGRRGVRALAAVAVAVVLTAAFLAWRARPHVDPIAAPPASPATGPHQPIPGAAAADATGPAASTGSAASTGLAASTGPVVEVVVSVGGKVAKPGLIRLPAGSRVADAIAAAGGARPGTDAALLNLARKVVDGEQILVGVAPPPGAAPAGPAPGGAPAGPVNLNTATVTDLDSLPGVGPVLAQRILDARTTRGGFRAVADLRQVEGIGTARYEQLKDLVTV
jgi:competence protein ComEA